MYVRNVKFEWRRILPQKFTFFTDELWWWKSLGCRFYSEKFKVRFGSPQYLFSDGCFLGGRLLTSGKNFPRQIFYWLTWMVVRSSVTRKLTNQYWPIFLDHGARSVDGCIKLKYLSGATSTLSGAVLAVALDWWQVQEVRQFVQVQKLEVPVLLWVPEVAENYRIHRLSTGPTEKGVHRTVGYSTSQGMSCNLARARGGNFSFI